ncbi:unnamed protein product [Phyllotreta striolata]|uniref:Uncharacterized protein n=1 Tax=Phyllotreta striolata TaxID=444603 RepID=A0A9N9TF77_PHYSR|nr:unnamed protein product [Phyllotreta striolata]
MKFYFMSSFGAVLRYFEYSFWKGLVCEFINLQMAFIWNFADVLIMLMGWALKFRLHQVTIRVKSLKDSDLPNIIKWKTLRKDYLRVAALCESTNQKLSSLVLVSFSVNLYFVLKQIFRSLTKIKDSIELAYIYISFVLLVMRISLVIIFGSGVYDEWRDICFFLQSVKSSAFSPEVERFVKNASTYELALTGKNFFSIRRSLILQVSFVQGDLSVF